MLQAMPKLDTGVPVLPSVPAKKVRLANALAGSPFVRAAERIERLRPFTRVLNYHGTPARLRAGFEAQVDRLLARYAPADPFELESLLARGPGERAAMVFTFDDGLANNADVAADVLERRGIRAIFCVPVDFPDVPADEQAAWFRSHVRPASNAEHGDDDDLRAMSWDTVRALARRGHRVVCHSQSHLTIDRGTPDSRRRAEIVDAKAAIEAKLPGTPIDGFCWPIDLDAHATAAEALVRSTYRFALCGGSAPLFAGADPHRIHRTNLEASWPLEVVDLQLSGLLDAKHLVKALRARVRSPREAGA